MKTIIELANDLADLRVMAARGQCVTSDEVADAYKALEKAIAAARVADQREIEALKARIEVDFKRWQEAIANYDFERSLNQKLMDGSAKLTANNETLKSEVAAARLQENERCAKECESWRDAWIDCQGTYEFRGEGAAHCATAIRALIGKEST